MEISQNKFVRLLAKLTFIATKSVKEFAIFNGKIPFKMQLVIKYVQMSIKTAILKTNYVQNAFLTPKGYSHSRSKAIIQ